MMDIDKQFEGLNVTEYNSNRMTVYRIHIYLTQFNKAISLSDYLSALQQLEMFYAEITPKSVELKKDKEYDLMKQNIMKSRKLVYNRGSSISWRLNCQQSLMDTLQSIMITTNAIGLGLTKKSDGFGGMRV